MEDRHSMLEAAAVLDLLKARPSPVADGDDGEDAGFRGGAATGAAPSSAQPRRTKRKRKTAPAAQPGGAAESDGDDDNDDNENDDDDGDDDLRKDKGARRSSKAARKPARGREKTSASTLASAPSSLDSAGGAPNSGSASAASASAPSRRARTGGEGLGLDEHMQLLDAVASTLVTNLRNERDWNALYERLLQLHPWASQFSSVSLFKQRCKLIFQERRKRQHVTTWKAVAAARDAPAITALISRRLQLGAIPPAAVQWDFSQLGAFLSRQVMRREKSPGSVLDWPPGPRADITAKLIGLHAYYGCGSFYQVHAHVAHLLQPCEVELALLSVCNCEGCAAWGLQEVRENMAELRLHWTRRRATLMRHVLAAHRDARSDGEEFVSRARAASPVFAKWRADDLRTMLHVAHTARACKVCTMVSQPRKPKRSYSRHAAEGAAEGADGAGAAAGAAAGSTLGAAAGGGAAGSAAGAAAWPEVVPGPERMTRKQLDAQVRSAAQANANITVARAAQHAQEVAQRQRLLHESQATESDATAGGALGSPPPPPPLPPSSALGQATQQPQMQLQPQMQMQMPSITSAAAHAYFQASG